MYDEKNECWEIVDGQVKGEPQSQGTVNTENLSDNITQLFEGLTSVSDRKIVFNKLAHIARNNQVYSKEIDKWVLSQPISIEKLFIKILKEEPMTAKYLFKFCMAPKYLRDTEIGGT